MDYDITRLQESAKKKEQQNKKLLDTIKRTKPKNLDNIVHNLHEEVFSNTDCLACANCCKTTSPIFYEPDIERVSRHLKMKKGRFIEEYLHVDEDGDYVLNSAPCPFLAPDNFCIVYDSRPTACREYPHTNRKRFHQILNITLKNTFICPAVFKIVEKLGEKLSKDKKCP